MSTEELWMVSLVWVVPLIVWCAMVAGWATTVFKKGFERRKQIFDKIGEVIQENHNTAIDIIKVQQKQFDELQKQFNELQEQFNKQQQTIEGQQACIDYQQAEILSQQELIEYLRL